MQAKKMKAAVYVAAITLLIQESTAIPSQQRYSKKSTPAVSIDILGGNRRNAGLRYPGGANFKPRLKLRFRGKYGRISKSSTNAIVDQRTKRNKRSSSLDYVNVPPEVVRRFGGIVPQAVIAHFNDLSSTARERNVGAQTRLSGQPEYLRTPFESGQVLSRNALPEVRFGDFNYDHLIRHSSPCGEGRQENSLVNDANQATSPAPPPPPQPNIPLLAEHKKKLIVEHNEYRSNVFPEAADMRALSWDDELEYVSQTFTNSCYYQDLIESKRLSLIDTDNSRTVKLRRHSYFSTEIGHAWFSWPETYDIPHDFAEVAFQAWESEKQFFNRETMECDALCEHYLQLIWAETFKIGCSMAWCENPNINGVSWPQALLFVCSYTPRGGVENFMAANSHRQSLHPTAFIEPYNKGTPCSLCVSDAAGSTPTETGSLDDKCWNNLCSNDQRDQKIQFDVGATTTQFQWVRTTTKISTTTTTTTNMPATSAEAPNPETTTDIETDGQNPDDDGSATVQEPPIRLLIVTTLTICLYQIT